VSRVAVIVVLLGLTALAAPPRSAIADEPISLDAFRDGINHWKNGHDADGYPSYRPEQTVEIADNILRYQRANGGWPPNIDPLRILSEREIRELDDSRSADDTSFDNRATYPEVVYLAEAFTRTGDERYRQAAIRGLEFILSAQYEHGGFPHSFPRKDGYRPYVTIVDDVMVGVLGTLRRASSGDRPFEWVDVKLRDRLEDALVRGEACLLQLQVEVEGVPAGWAGQYDPETLRPKRGRAYELPALISAESANVVRYLMQVENPSPAVRRAVHGGIAWLERSKITGLRIDRVPIDPVRYPHHTSRHDVVAVEDAKAPPLWARYYEIDSNRPFMANRDGTKVYRLADVAPERRTGYAWYVRYDHALLEKEYPAWKNTWGEP